MGQVRASGTIRNSNLISCTRMANQRSEADIYHMFFVWVGGGAPCLREGGMGLWPLSASHWPNSGSLAPVGSFPLTLDSAFGEGCLRPPRGHKP